MNHQTKRATEGRSAWPSGRGGLLGLSIILALAAGGSVHAAKLCVPQASGVPRLVGAAPNFLDQNQGDPNYWPRPDDPRWRGALARSWGAGTSPHLTFRVLRVAGADPALYMSWVVKVAPMPQENADKLRVAFATGDAAGDATKAFEINPFPSHADTLDTFEAKTPTAANNVQAWRLKPDSTWEADPDPIPPWLTNNTRMWADTSSQMWAINMKVPITNPFGDGRNISDLFPVAFHLDVTHPLGNIVEYTLDDLSLIPDPVEDPPPPPSKIRNNWTHFNLSPSPAPDDCDKGISIARADVGTTNPAGPHLMSLNPSTPPQFFVNPRNEMSVPAPSGNVAATIRLANWGTQNLITSLWKEITPNPQTNAVDIPTYPSPNPPPASGFISFTWNIPNEMRCEFTGQDPNIPGTSNCPDPQPTRSLHQCILVTLQDGPPAPGYTYNPSSVVRNMDFVDASIFQRKAEVSVAGLHPLSGGAPKRDVYLYVQTFQMPKDVGAPQRYSTMFDLAKVQAILDPGERDPKRAVSATVEVPASKRPPLGVDFETLDQQFPTYLVHAFHDTGRTVVVNGRKRRVLEPQTSFGYYVSHHGPLAGWETYLEGAEQIAPNYYRIAVPQGGTETVTTRIVAREYDRYAVWLAYGQTFPHGSFGNLHESGPAANLGFEYALSAVTSLEGTLGAHRFNGKEGVADIDVTQFGINGKWSFVRQGFTPFVTLGAGAYAFDPGSTRFGLNLGAGVRLPFAPHWSVEGRYVAHHIEGNAPNTNYSTLQIGLRYAFF